MRKEEETKRANEGKNEWKRKERKKEGKRELLVSPIIDIRSGHISLNSTQILESSLSF